MRGIRCVRLHRCRFILFVCYQMQWSGTLLPRFSIENRMKFCEIRNSIHFGHRALMHDRPMDSSVFAFSNILNESIWSSANVDTIVRPCEHKWDPRATFELRENRNHCCFLQYSTCSLAFAASHANSLVTSHPHTGRWCSMRCCTFSTVTNSPNVRIE